MIGRLAVALGAGVSVLAGSCQPAASPCPPETLAAIEADYSARVVALCKGQALDDCDAVPALKADRTEAELKASCR